jgi:hypothetical protein
MGTSEWTHVRVNEFNVDFECVVVIILEVHQMRRHNRVRLADVKSMICKQIVVNRIHRQINQEHRKVHRSILYRPTVSVLFHQAGKCRKLKVAVYFSLITLANEQLG